MPRPVSRDTSSSQRRGLEEHPHRSGLRRLDARAPARSSSSSTGSPAARRSSTGARGVPERCRPRGSRPTRAGPRAPPGGRSPRADEVVLPPVDLPRPGRPGGRRDAEPQAGRPSAQLGDDGALADPGGAGKDQQPAPGRGTARRAGERSLAVELREQGLALALAQAAQPAAGAISSRSMICSARTLPTPGRASSSAETFILPSTSSESACFEHVTQAGAAALEPLLELGPGATGRGCLLQRGRPLLLGQLGKCHGLLRLRGLDPSGRSASDGPAHV